MAIRARLDGVAFEDATEEDEDLLTRGVDAAAPRGWKQIYADIPYDKTVRFNCDDEKRALYIRQQVRKHAKDASESVTVAVAEGPWRVLVHRENPTPEPAAKDPARTPPTWAPKSPEVKDEPPPPRHRIPRRCARSTAATAR